VKLEISNNIGLILKFDFEFGSLVMKNHTSNTIRKCYEIRAI